MSPRPLDLLEATLGDHVTVRLKGGEAYTGALGGYDQHLNVVLEPGEGDGADGGESGESAAPEGPAGPAAEPVDTTTIIRGDNVVSVTT